MQCSITFFLGGFHSYYAEVDDVGSSQLTAQGGSMVTLPMFYLEGMSFFSPSTSWDSSDGLYTTL